MFVVRLAAPGSPPRITTHSTVRRASSTHRRHRNCISSLFEFSAWAAWLDGGRHPGNRRAADCKGPFKHLSLETADGFLAPPPAFIVASHRHLNRMSELLCLHPLFAPPDGPRTKHLSRNPAPFPYHPSTQSRLPIGHRDEKSHSLGRCSRSRRHLCPRQGRLRLRRPSDRVRRRIRARLPGRVQRWQVSWHLCVSLKESCEETNG